MRPTLKCCMESLFQTILQRSGVQPAERLTSLGIARAQIKATPTPHEHHGNAVPRYSSGALNWDSVMPYKLASEKNAAGLFRRIMGDYSTAQLFFSEMSNLLGERKKGFNPLHTPVVFRIFSV